MDAKFDVNFFMALARDTDKRLDWQCAEIRKVPSAAIEALTEEYNNSGFLDNPNLRGEFIINEFSVRNGNGEKFYKPERKAVVYERQR